MQSAATNAPPFTGSIEGFAYGALSLQVAAPTPATLRWLGEFLSPSFCTGRRDRYTATVTLREDTAAYDDTLARRPPSGTAELDCFVNDSHLIRLPSWTSASATTVTAFQESWRVLYSLDRQTRAASVLSQPDNPRARTSLMRVVRELAMNHSLRGGGMFLHAAAMALGGRGLLIAGEKGAGKTTLLLHLLRQIDGDYVSNDRVLLAVPDSPIVRGMPTIVTLRPNTLASFPDLASAVRARSYHYRRTLAEAAEHQKPARSWTDGSIGLSPLQLCTILGVALAPECELKAILFPSITPAADTFHLRELAPAEAAARLRRAWLSAGLPKRTSDLFTLPDDPPSPGDAHLEETGRALVERVRAFECQLGARAYAGAALATACRRMLDP
jgi:hypothetical protein